jgi:hypothetical protein
MPDAIYNGIVHTLDTRSILMQKSPGHPCVEDVDINLWILRPTFVHWPSAVPVCPTS